MVTMIMLVVVNLVSIMQVHVVTTIFRLREEKLFREWPIPAIFVPLKL